MTKCDSNQDECIDCVFTNPLGFGPYARNSVSRLHGQILMGLSLIGMNLGEVLEGLTWSVFFSSAAIL